MESVELNPSFFEGAVSVECGDGWLKPWRIPEKRRGLFPVLGDTPTSCGAFASGVRLRFETDSQVVKLNFQPIGEDWDGRGHSFDVSVDGKIVSSVVVQPGAVSASFELSSGRKTVEIWLPIKGPIWITGLDVQARGICRTVADRRPRWITYGSSITFCIRAHSSARIWPAIVARRCGLNLTSLGFGGQCHLEPMMAKTIRDLAADLITLKLGINCIGSVSYSPRTFPAAVIGMVQTIRENHPHTPIALISPIACPRHETAENAAGYSLTKMRSDIARAHGLLTANGDANLYYVDGLDIFNESEIRARSTDLVHPDGDGMEIMAERMVSQVMWRLGF